MGRYLLVLPAILAVTYCQIEFPELPTQRLDSEHTEKRVPLYAPEKCPENQLLYPGDQDHDWICDCGLGYIYYPAKDGCFAAYRQGPCDKGKHLIIKRGEVVPACAVNPCEDGFALYEGKCYELGKPNGPCAPVKQGGGIFDVNATTLRVECLKGTDRLSLFSIPNQCNPGSKRDRNGNCRVVYK
ncbi:uncharacterized protein LOC108905852 [Anoplophora glabripennis]|uniref:uncharacterized protein LOC108905852 n=1 Tax=Anoplophora glabripennis TaxID=217634 RepID=UPI00087587CE|nr:uncharacterized protein LOC108905852 [Anoplophora glabripennis]